MTFPKCVLAGVALLAACNFSMAATSRSSDTAAHPVQTVKPSERSKTLRIEISHDPALRERQIERIQKLMAKASTRKNLAAKSLAPAASVPTTNWGGYGDCGLFDDEWADCDMPGSIEALQRDWYPSIDGGGGGEYVAKTATLDLVTIEGNCTIQIVSSFGTSTALCRDIEYLKDQLAMQQLSNRIGVSKVGDAVDDAKKLMDIVSPLVQRCAVVSSSSVFNTPDKDEQMGWPGAVDAVILAYAGDFGSIRVGYRIDVKYSSGAIAQVVVMQKYPISPSTPQGYLKLQRSNFPVKNDSACK